MFHHLCRVVDVSGIGVLNQEGSEVKHHHHLFLALLLK